MNPANPLFSIFQAYASELPNWLRRLHVSAPDVSDAIQEVWLGFCECPEQVPADATKAREVLFDLTKRVAQRIRRQAMRNALRHCGADPDALPRYHSLDDEVAAAIIFANAIDQLDEPHRGLCIAHLILGYTAKEMAQQLGIAESAAAKRIWRAVAQLQKVQRDERRKKDHGVLIVPFELDIAPDIRAAMCAIWSAEGRMPKPWYSPIMRWTARAWVWKTLLAALILPPLLASDASTIGQFLWSQPIPDVARAGLHVPAAPVLEGTPSDFTRAFTMPTETIPPAASPLSTIRPMAVKPEPANAKQARPEPSNDRVRAILPWSLPAGDSESNLRKAH